MTYDYVVKARDAAGNVSDASNVATATTPTDVAAPQNTDPPAITGTPTVGNTLAASTGSWSSAEEVTYAYQWQRCDAAGESCAALTGATSTSYTVQTADVGQTVRVQVTATNIAGSAAAFSTATGLVQPAPSDPTNVPAPTTPPAEICGNAAFLEGAAVQPSGSVRIAVTENANDVTKAHPPGTTFWFEPGTHTLGTSMYGQIMPKEGNTYLGAPGAVLDGKGVNRYAFTQRATGVTIRHLTVRGFVAPMNEAVVNQSAATGWTIEGNTIIDNGGAGVFVGSDNVIRDNCLKDNGQYGFSMYRPAVAYGYGPSAITNIVIDHNEIVGNNTGDWESKVPGCGCTGGGKFWDVRGAKVTNNWVHHNRGVALWADTNNIDFLIEGNYISDNDGEAIWYEISYNAAIRNNTLKRNTFVKGRAYEARGDTFPIGSIYIAESGGDSRVSPSYNTLEVSGNVLQDNWGGVVLWEAAERFCNSPGNTSGKYCTKVNPDVTSETCAAGRFPDGAATAGSTAYRSEGATFNWNDIGATLTSPNVPAGTTIARIDSTSQVTLSAAATGSGSGLEFLIGGRSATNQIHSGEPFYSDCRWKTQNVLVHDNTFTMDKTAIGCTTNLCGRVALISGYGTAYPKWSPYLGTVIQERITFNSNNTFRDNTYVGDWTFTPYSANRLYNLGTWQAAPYNQDAGSTQSGQSRVANDLDADTATLEGTIGKWVPWYSTSAVRSADQAHGGTGSLRVDVTAAYGWGVALSNYPGFYATSGDKTISFWGRLGSGSNLGVTMRVKWRDATNSVIKTETVAISTLTSTWEQRTLDVVVPSTANAVTVEFVSASGAVGDYLYLDDIVVGDR